MHMLCGEHAATVAFLKTLQSATQSAMLDFPQVVHHVALGFSENILFLAQ
jgi:hypothetical protein